MTAAARSVTDDKLLGALAVAVSFGLTIVLFGFVVLAGVGLLAGGLALRAAGRRRTAERVLGVAAVTLAGPIIYVGLAVLQS